MTKLLTKEQVFQNPESCIKYLCFYIYITIDNQVFSLSMNKLKEQLIGGSYSYYCNGRYRTKKWIRANCINVLGLITE
jgi:hypothetical protein